MLTLYCSHTSEYDTFTIDQFGGPLRVVIPPFDMNDIQKKSMVRTLLMLNGRQDPDPSVVEIRTHAGEHPLIDTWHFE